MKILIKVTKEILERTKSCGRAKKGMNCAVAVAVGEVFQNVWVARDTMYVFDDTPTLLQMYYRGLEDVLKSGAKVTQIELPEIASNFIRHFDNRFGESRIMMKPISFEIDVPNEVIDSIGIPEVYKILSESKTLELASIN